MQYVFSDLITIFVKNDILYLFGMLINEYKECRIPVKKSKKDAKFGKCLSADIRKAFFKMKSFGDL